MLTWNVDVDSWHGSPLQPRAWYQSTLQPFHTVLLSLHPWYAGIATPASYLNSCWEQPLVVPCPDLPRLATQVSGQHQNLIFSDIRTLMLNHNPVSTMWYSVQCWSNSTPAQLRAVGLHGRAPSSYWKLNNLWLVHTWFIDCLCAWSGLGFV